MGITIGSARHDEKNGYTGGAKGDGLQTSVPDHKGEVSMQNFYVHKKGWNVLRPKDPDNAKRMADTARRLVIPAFPEDKFVEAVLKTIRIPRVYPMQNTAYLPLFSSAYRIRPFYFIILLYLFQ